MSQASSLPFLCARHVLCLSRDTRHPGGAREVATAQASGLFVEAVEAGTHPLSQAARAGYRSKKSETLTSHPLSLLLFHLSG